MYRSSGRHFLRAKSVLTVHDVNFEIYPQDFTLPARWRLKAFVGSSIRKADAIFTVSEYGRQQIHSVYGVPLEKITVTYNAADHLRFDGHKPTDRTPEQLNLPPRYLFFVGAIQPKKNLARLVRAFDKLVSTGDVPHHLLIAGKWGWGNDDLTAALNQITHRDRVRLMGYLSKGELVETMRRAGSIHVPIAYMSASEYRQWRRNWQVFLPLSPIQPVSRRSTRTQCCIAIPRIRRLHGERAARAGNR